jgi:cytochrome P450
MITSAHTPEARPIPFISETSPRDSADAFTQDRLRFLQRLAAVGDICGFHLGPMTMVLFNNVEYVQSILVEHSYEYFSKSQMARKFTSRDGLFISEGDAHRKRRKVMAPMFQPRHIANYAEEIVQCGEQIAQTWSDGMIIDVNQQMVNLTRSVILKVLFGIDAGEQAEKIVAAILTGFKHSARLASAQEPPENWSPAYHRQIQETKDFLEMCIRQMIEERRTLQAASSSRIDMLSVLVETLDEDGQQMSDQQVIDECILLFTAGYETTMAALSWTWYFLCQNPDIYQQVRQEVKHVLQGRRATANDLAQLPLCLQVFKETMRLYPPVPSLTREVLEDITIDGYHIPKGTSLLVAPYTLQRNATYFPEPEKFDPRHFTPENEKRLPRYAYFPFGAGPRICMGNHLVFMEGQLLIATLVQLTSFELVPGQTIEPDLVRNLSLRPNGKMEVTVHKNT